MTRRRAVPTLAVLSAAFSSVLASCAQAPPPPPVAEPTPPPPETSASLVPAASVAAPPAPTTPADRGADEAPKVAAFPVVPTFVEGDPDRRSSAQLCLGNIVPRLRPGKPVDSLEIRTLQRQGQQIQVVVTGRAGSPCGTAKDLPACQRAFDAARPPNHEEIYVFTRGDEVGVVTRTEVPAFLAPIDSAEEAAAVLVYAPPDDKAEVDCDPATFKVTGATFTSVQKTGGRCEHDVITFSVSKAGKARRISTRHVVEQRPCRMPVKGRRPEGLAPIEPHAIDGAGDGALGAYLAEACTMEAASVTSFRRLERELAALGAPRGLRRRASASALDEARHTRLMRRLARRAGAEPKKPRIARIATRSPLAIALENAVEGCVHETWSALVARFQADHANDGELRAAMEIIARDEARHAALAWDVRAWLDQRLTDDERARVREAYEAALATLGDAMEDGLDSGDRRALGLPSAETTRALAAAWSEAARTLDPRCGADPRA